MTISGFSAGAYMSHQMHVIYSKFFKGAGLIAGGPYMVAEDSDIFQVDPKEKPTDIAEESIRKLDRKHKHG